MGWWTDLRDTAEAVAVPVGNYFLPGSSLVTSHLVSDGAKQKLNSDFGNLAMLGSGIAGGANGNMSNYSGLNDMFTAPPTSGVDYQNGADIGGAGSSPATLGGTGSAPATPAFAPTTVAQGNNLPVDTTTGPINPTSAANLPDNIDAGGGFNPAAGYTAPQGFLPSLMNGNFGDAANAAGNWAMKNPIPAIYGAGSLYDMYAKKQMANKQQDLYNQNRADIMGMYAPGSAEYNSLMNEMSRKDAAAGRNSQYGARAVDLAGKIANYKTTALANMQNGQNTLANQGMGNQFGMMNTPLTLAALTATQKGG